MLVALLNSAGWAKFEGETPEVGIITGVYAAVFGWFTWKQSFAGTVVGFILWALMHVAAALVYIHEGDFSTPLRGWWATIGQGMLLLNGVRGAHYMRQHRMSSNASPTGESVLYRTSTIGTFTKMPKDSARDPNRSIAEQSRGQVTGIHNCPSCGTKVLPTGDGRCPACQKTMV